MEATLPDAFEASQSGPGLPHGGGSAGLEGIGKAPPAGPFVKVHGMLVYRYVMNLGYWVDLFL